MKTTDFNYGLPPGLIAQTPVEPRDNSRLLVLNRQTGELKHQKFFELPVFLKKGDVLVFNNTRVIPARLYGKRTGTGGKLEVLLLKKLDDGTWEVLLKPGKSMLTGTRFFITGRTAGIELSGEVIGQGDNGIRRVRFSDDNLLFAAGHVPLPPYIHTPLDKPERYQTVYAQIEGSAAAPTAGLHFTAGLIQQLRQTGIECLFVTLHVGLDTFQPVHEDNPADHHIHTEFGVIEPDAAASLNKAKDQGRRIVCVGTTSTRIVEQAAQSSNNKLIEPFNGPVSLYILPGYTFKMTDALITNFHLPHTTLLMLVSAFAGRELLLGAYREAIRERYRFYSFGDAMLII